MWLQILTRAHIDKEQHNNNTAAAASLATATMSDPPGGSLPLPPLSHVLLLPGLSRFYSTVFVDEAVATSIKRRRRLGLLLLPMRHTVPWRTTTTNNTQQQQQQGRLRRSLGLKKAAAACLGPISRHFPHRGRSFSLGHPLRIEVRMEREGETRSMKGSADIFHAF